MAILPGSVLLGAMLTFVHVRLRQFYLLFERPLLGLQYVREPSVESIDDALARGGAGSKQARQKAANSKKQRKTKAPQGPVVFQIPTFTIDREFFTRTRPFYVEFDNCFVVMTAFAAAYFVERAVVCYSGPNSFFRGSEWMLLTLLGIACFEAFHILKTLHARPSDYHLAWVVGAMGVLLSSVALLSTDSEPLDFNFAGGFEKFETNMLAMFLQRHPNFTSPPSFRAPLIVVISLLCGLLSASLAFPCIRFSRLLFQRLNGDIPNSRGTTGLILVELCAPAVLALLWVSDLATALLNGLSLAGYTMTLDQFASCRITLAVMYAIYRILLLRRRAQDYLNTGAVPMSEVATLSAKSNVASQITQHRIFAIHMHIFTAALMYVLPAVSFIALGLLASMYDPNIASFCVPRESNLGQQSVLQPMTSISPASLSPELAFAATSFLLWWGLLFVSFFSLACLLSEKISATASPSAVFESSASLANTKQRMSAFTIIFLAAKQLGRTMTNKMNSGPVVWTGSGEESNNCAGCSAEFTMMFKRHLCRSCGDGFCTKCSNRKVPVPEREHPAPVRVCDACFVARQRDKARGSQNSSNSGHFGDEEAEKRREKQLAAMEALNRIYKAKIKPVEDAFKFSSFYQSELSDGDFEARPMVLMIGQYSVGKTSFIRYLLERDFPGQRIGPEPTTDRFLAVMQGSSERTIPGNAAAVDSRKPFSGLLKFGTAFLNRFEVAELSSPILDSISLIDTPGILSGEKQRVERGYDFEETVKWFAERADRILLLFDAHKLDISDELQRSIEVLKGQDEKIRVVLNKSDSVTSQQLMRVYGALMWSLGKVIRSPEVLRVYISSFWDQPFNEIGVRNADLFDAERQDLLADLRSLPSQSSIRKVNELVKRARLAKVHALLVSYLYGKMPYVFGQKSQQAKLIGRLKEEYVKVAKANAIPLGDFPLESEFRRGMEGFDISEFPKLSARQIAVLDGGLTKDIPALIRSLHETLGMAADTARRDTDASNPFESSPDYSSGEAWVIDATAKAQWDILFVKIGAHGDPPKVDGAAARPLMMESGLPQNTLRQIWDLADCDQDGFLDGEEFALAMHLIKGARISGAQSIPETLPASYVPPSKRQ